MVFPDKKPEKNNFPVISTANGPQPQPSPIVQPTLNKGRRTVELGPIRPNIITTVDHLLFSLDIYKLSPASDISCGRKK